MRNNNKNIQQAKQAAHRLYKKVNFDGGNLQTYELSSLMQETYDYLKISFKPTTNDLKQYSKVLDSNGDGSVSLQDLQAVAANFLCGEGVLQQTVHKKSVGFSQSNQYSSFGKQSSGYSSTQTAKKPLYQGQDYGLSNYGAGNKSSQQQYTAQAYSAYNAPQQTYNRIPKYDSAGSDAQTSRFGSYGINQAANYSQNYSSNSYQTKQHRQSHQYAQESYDMPSSRYTPTAQSYLGITRGLFKKYANRPSGTITKDKVGPLLTETYGALGRQGYYPSDQDVNVWMKLCDTNADGEVEEAEYEYFVVRALQRSGIQVNNN